MGIENPIIKGEHKSFQFNDYVKHSEFQCIYCHEYFDEYTGGIQLEDDTYCGLNCLTKYLKKNGILKDI